MNHSVLAVARVRAAEIVGRQKLWEITTAFRAIRIKNDIIRQIYKAIMDDRKARKE